MNAEARVLSLLLVGILVVTSLIIVKPTFAQPPITLPVITISSNGSIQSSLSPSPIVNEGKMYVVNENISGYGIDIQCSNILLLGEGNTLQATAEYNTNSGITIEGSGVTVENVTIIQYYVGIDIKGSSNKISGNIISAYDNGINVEGQYNIITENQISNCGGSGIELSNSMNNINANTINCNNGCCITVDSGGSSNTISGNLLISGTFDIEMYGNSNNVVGNTLTGGSHGIIFYDPANANTIDKNDIISNYEGIGLDEQINTFFLNNLINNTYDVRLHIFSDPYAPYSMNVFDNGSVGNYWGDYTAKYPNAIETGNTGIYNTPYVIDGNITDKYPLTTPYIVGSTGAQISTLSSPNPTSTPTVPELSMLAVIGAFLAVSASVAVLAMAKKRKIGN